MEGRGLSGFFRNASEELFLKTLMENSDAMPAPTMEMLGFRNLSQNFRADSEELFKSWLTNADQNPGHNSPRVAHRRQLSKRISMELANLSNHQQQHGEILPSKRSYGNSSAQNSSAVNDIPGDLCQDDSSRNAVERGWQASNLYLAKAWFHSSQPMTRSRSSELRRKYAATQNAQTAIGMQAMQNGQGLKMKQDFGNPNGFTDHSMNEIPEQLGTFVSPSNSSSSTFSAQPVGNNDKVSSVVDMLKGTLERKRLANRVDREASGDCDQGFLQAQGIVTNTNFYQGQGSTIHETSSAFDEVFSSNLKEAVARQNVEPIDLDFEGYMNAANPIQQGTVSREPSQSESSAAAPVVSPSFDAYDGPGNSTQTLNIAESPRKHARGSTSAENGSAPKDFRERIIDNFEDDRKRGRLVRYGCVTSAGSTEKGDPTKKRRVERSRKMAEAKERNSTTMIPSDMQSVLKRCDNLEKEVRSLKLNLSFMNRKDSEQTKQIEELQKQNDELAEEKERLLEEIERILAESGNI